MQEQMATLRVTLSTVGDGCGQDNTAPGMWPHHGWYVALLDCHGNPFTKAGKSYGPREFPVNHGYIEIPDVPPGTYLLYAMVNPFHVGGGGIWWQSNFVSHFAVVEVCCNCDTICVKLYNSGWHYCVRIILPWLNMLAESKQLDPAIAKAAVDALNKALIASKLQPLPADANALKHIESLVQELPREKG